MDESWIRPEQSRVPGAGDPAVGAGPVLPDHGREAPTARGRRRVVRLVATGVVLALLVWFAFANLQAVPIHFWVVTKTAPLVVVIAISGVLGALVSATWSRARRRRAERAR